MKTQKMIQIVAVLSLIVAASIWYSQNHGLLPVQAAEEATLYDNLFNALIAIATGIFLIVQGTIIYSLIRFRRRKGDDTDGIALHDNFLLEIVWTAVPTVLVMWVGIYSFDVYNSMKGNTIESLGIAHNHSPISHVQIANLAMPAAMAATLPANGNKNPAIAQVDGSTAPLTIDVSAMRYAWIFTYPGTEIVTSELHIPVGRKIKLNLSAQDVNHAFWVPQFRLKQDTIPGITTNLVFTANKLGEYPVICAELCGGYHGGMRTTVTVQTPSQYTAWLKEEQEVASQSPQTLALKQPSEMTDGEFLSEQVQAMGIDREALSSMHHADHDMHEMAHYLN
jgi:cytochrome c oxidase subunit II